MNKPKVGDKLFSLNVGNRARYSPQELTPVTVEKVGRKYFYCTTGKHSHQTRYNINNWIEATGFTPTSKLYKSKQQWEDEKESKEICSLIKESFEYGRNKKSLPLAALRRIKAELKE